MSTTALKVMTTKQEANVKRVQELLAEYMAGRVEGYLAGVADNIKGSILAGVVPGGESINNKEEFIALMPKMEEHIEVKRFEPCNFRPGGNENDVLFNVDWVLVYKPTGKEVSTRAIVRKVLDASGNICEKYHMVDAEAITGIPQPEAKAVTRVKALLAEYMAGRPEGYMAGVADNVKASMLGGLIPGADRIGNKVEFAAVMGTMDSYMDVLSFEPKNFLSMPNNDMCFEVDWKLVWKATGRTVETTALVRKVLDAEGNICEKYHMVDCAAICAESPRNVIDHKAQEA